MARLGEIFRNALRRVIQSALESGQDTGPSTPPDDFRVRLWEICYVYGCYLSEDVPNLKDAARRLLKAKFATAALLPDGEVGFREGDVVGWGSMSEDDSINARRTQITFHDIPETFRESIFLAAMERSAARNVFSFHAPPNDQSVFIILPDLIAYLSPEHPITLQVTIRLFESGIVLVSFRSRLTSQGTSLRDFVDFYVNLAQRNLYAIESDKDVAFFLVDAFLRDQVEIKRGLHIPRTKIVIPLPNRVAIPILRIGSRTVLTNQSRDVEIIGPEPPDGRIRMTGSDTSQLSGIAFEYARGIAYALGRPRKGLPYLLLGEPSTPYWTGFWSGGPHIHLLDFSDQCLSASENERRHRESFKWIMARIRYTHGRRIHIDLPQNTRAFDDYSVYINESAVLWVYTTDPERQQHGDGTEGDPYFLATRHHQVKGELLEYAYILYASIVHELEQKNLAWDRIFSIRERQIRFDLDIDRTGRFGEIRTLLATGLRARRVPEIREQTASFISLRESMASVRESRRMAVSAIVLTSVVGLLGLPDAVRFLNEYVAPHIPYLAKLTLGSPKRIGIVSLATALSVAGISVAFWLLFKRLPWIAKRDRIKRD